MRVVLDEGFDDVPFDQFLALLGDEFRPLLAVFQLCVDFIIAREV